MLFFLLCLPLRFRSWGSHVFDCVSLPLFSAYSFTGGRGTISSPSPYLHMCVFVCFAIDLAAHSSYIFHSFVGLCRFFYWFSLYCLSWMYRLFISTNCIRYVNTEHWNTNTHTHIQRLKEWKKERQIHIYELWNWKARTLSLFRSVSLCVTHFYSVGLILFILRLHRAFIWHKIFIVGAVHNKLSHVHYTNTLCVFSLSCSTPFYFAIRSVSSSILPSILISPLPPYMFVKWKIYFYFYHSVVRRLFMFCRYFYSLLGFRFFGVCVRVCVSARKCLYLCFFHSRSLYNSSRFCYLPTPFCYLSYHFFWLFSFSPVSHSQFVFLSFISHRRFTVLMDTQLVRMWYKNVST